MFRRLLGRQVKPGELDRYMLVDLRALLCMDSTVQTLKCAASATELGEYTEAFSEVLWELEPHGQRVVGEA